MNNSDNNRPGLKFDILKNNRGKLPLWINGKQDLYYSKGFKILRQSQGSVIEKNTVEKSNLEKLVGWNSLVRRVLRMEIGALVELPNGNLVGVKRKAIITKKKGTDHFQITYRIDRGNRPLNLCVAEGKVYWGEYFSNPKRGEVHIYGSKDGFNWERVYTFPSNSVRHIHGIYSDKHRKGIWVLTGDSNKESGLWFTSDYFQSLEQVTGGSQKARAVSIIPDSKGLIVPMDSPKEENFIQRFYLENGSFVNLKALPGSAFNCYTNDQLSLISTVVEPSQVNKAKYAEIFASTDLENWVSIGKLFIDFWSSISLKYFRYPEVVFVKSSDKDPDHVYFYCRGVRKYNNRMIVLTRKSIEQYLLEMVKQDQ